MDEKVKLCRDVFGLFGEHEPSNVALCQKNSNQNLRGGSESQYSSGILGIMASVQPLDIHEVRVFLIFLRIEGEKDERKGKIKKRNLN